MKYKAVIFDFNGTLFFDNDKHVKAWNEISMLLRKRPITDIELHEKFNGRPNEQIIQYMLDNKATIEEIHKYSLLKESYYRKFCQEDQEHFHLVAGATEYFEYLKENNILFTIASASIKENIDFFVESFSLTKWFKEEDIIYDNGTYENKVQMFKDATKQWKIPMQDIIVFEDSLAGIQNAYQAGITNIIVIASTDIEKYTKLPGVIKIISDFTKLNITHKRM